MQQRANTANEIQKTMPQADVGSWQPPMETHIKLKVITIRNSNGIGLSIFSTANKGLPSFTDSFNTFIAEKSSPKNYGE